MPRQSSLVPGLVAGLTEVVPRGVEGHAGDGRGVCDRLEGFLGRGFTVVEELDCEVQ